MLLKSVHVHQACITKNTQKKNKMEENTQSLGWVAKEEENWRGMDGNMRAQKTARMIKSENQ
jgi:hypothetical protein